jgi:hypothetical protein
LATSDGVDLQALGRPEEDFLDDAGAGVRIDPDVHVAEKG